MKEEKTPRQLNKLLTSARKKIITQAAIAMSTIALLLVLVFAMSAAWYTNVVKSGDLIFQTAAWGFQGTVDIGDGAIEAGPGKSGVISLEVDNTGSDMIFAGVHIAKTMDEDLGKRIYLYVDAASTKNGETMQRVYLNSKDSYTYLVPSQNKLILRDQYYNDARIMWTWVYDVLGYYFLGTVNDTVTAEEEYLRPVEYDLDSATFDRNGKLQTVDGTTTLNQFVAKLSATDGYAGVIDPASAVNGYYPVNVDETGKGIWLYLCNWAEIQQEMETDIALGSAEEKKQGVVRLNISAQGGEYEITQVSTVTQLQAALNDPASGVIQLDTDLTLAELTSLRLSSGEDAVLNLNGHTISTSDATAAIEILNGSKLTIFDGTLQGCNVSNSVGIQVVNGELTMNQVAVNGMVDAIRVEDDLGSGQDSMIRLSECDITAIDCAIYARGNGGRSGQLTQITIEKSTLHGDLGAIWGSGNSTTWGTSIQILDSTVTGGAAAIYHPQRDSNLTITNSTLSGDMGLAIKGGDAHIIDTSITATGEGDPTNMAPGVSLSGFIDIGSAIYLEANYDCSMSVTVEGEKTVVNSEKDLAIRVNPLDAPNATVVVKGGTFNTSVADFVAEGYTFAVIDRAWVVTKSESYAVCNWGADPDCGCFPGAISGELDGNTSVPARRGRKPGFASRQQLGRGSGYPQINIFLGKHRYRSCGRGDICSGFQRN